MIRRALAKTGIGILLFLCCYTPRALAQEIPVDPNVKIGKLSNGLTYYIRQNTEPKKRAELRLVVKAGSILETDSQQGLAHFMEHMNFNGTVNFPKNELVNFLQKAGVKFGADLNAYTGFNETVYMLPIPTDSAGLLETGLQVLEDWAHGALLDPAEIDKERGVVLEESRMGRGARQRMQDQYFKMILNHSRYAERLPIGKDSIIRNFQPETLQAFYKDWYRPDLMAVLAVGDFDPVAVEQLIQEKFSRIPPAENSKPRETYNIPLDGSNKVAIVTDSEYPQNLVQVIYQLPQKKEKTLADVRTTISRQLFNQMMGQRMSELTQKADPPFLVGFSNYSNFLADLDSYTSLALAKETEGLTTALATLVQENERVRKYGFTASELERTKQNFQHHVERAYKERDKSQSAQFVTAYTDHFLLDKSIMGIENYFAVATKTLPEISLEEVNQLAQEFMSDQNIAVVVMAPESGKAKLPSEKEILDLLATTGKEVTPYEDNVSDQPLLSQPPDGTPVIEKITDKQTDITELILGNGTRVYLKPTDFKNDQILFRATSPGGISLHQQEWFSAQFASYLIASGGVGPFDNTQLQKYLTGKTVSVRPFIGTLTEGFNGSTTPKDLETALQLMYAYFNTPRKDAEVVQGILSSQKAFLQNQQQTITPEKVFADTLKALVTNYHVLAKPLEAADIDKIDLDEAYRIYADRFSDASDFVFTFVGNFDIDTITPLLETYIGGLKATGRKETFDYPAIRPVAGHLEKTVFKGREPKSMVSMYFSGDYHYSLENNVQLDALGDILQIKLIEALREEESGVYGVGVSMNYHKFPGEQYNLSISFGCAPENVDKLIQRTLAEIKTIKEQGADPSDIGKFVAESRRKLEVATQTNSFWLHYIDTAVFQEEPLHQLYEEQTLWEKVTPQSTQETCSTYLNENQYIRLVLKPEHQ